MERVVSPVLQMFLPIYEEVRVTESPRQMVEALLVLIIGGAGLGTTLTTTGILVKLVQALSTWFTVKEPLLRTTMLWVLAPVLQIFPVTTLEVSTTLSPSQKVNGPLAVTNGATGVLEVILTTLETREVQLPRTALTE